MAELTPVYLIIGNDTPKIHAALRRLEGHFDDTARTNFDAGAAAADDVVGACSAMGLFSDQRLVIAQGVEGWKPAEVDVLLAYLEAPAPDSVLALTAEKLASNSRLLKACTASGHCTVLTYKGPDAKNMVPWVEQAFKRHGATVSRDVAARLVERSGIDEASPSWFDSTIQRVVTWAGDDQIEASHIDELVPESMQFKVFAITDAWSRSNRTELLAMADRLLDDPSTHPVQLTALLARHIRAVHAASRLLREMSPKDVAGQLDMHPWAAKKAVEQARTISQPRIDAAMLQIARMEAELKGFSALSSSSPALVFERGIVDLVV